MSEDTKVDNQEKPVWQGNAEVRAMTPELREMVETGWLPLDLEETFRFIPNALKGKPNAPVIIIRKPTAMDEVIEPNDALKKYATAFGDLAKREAERNNAIEKMKSEGIENPELPPVEDIDPKLTADAMMLAAKQIRGWEIKTAKGQPIPWVAKEDGTISEQSLKALAMMKMTWVSVMYAVMNARVITPLEVEGFGS